jgi:predicted Rossmann-fold nucleotide-binding protein
MLKLMMVVVVVVGGVGAVEEGVLVVGPGKKMNPRPCQGVHHAYCQ